MKTDTADALALPGSRKNGLSAGFARAQLAAASKILRAAGDPPVQFVLPSGVTTPYAGQTPVARVRFRSLRALPQLLVNPSVGFGEGFAAGDIEVEGDLVAFLEAIYRCGRSKPTAAIPAALRRVWGNTLSRATRNARHHYDVGNDFYRLWLDREMLYTCAYYPSPTLSLEDAQREKMLHVCRKLRLQRGETVVEAGCGWGALALFMARTFGVRVRACNVSHEQIVLARERAKAEGLDGQVEFLEDDYRNLSGAFDAFVSVGMLEHVGHEHYRDLGRVIDRCLKPHGRGLLHSIGRDRPARLDPWIRRRIFPGAYTPTLREMMDVLEPSGFSVLDVENLRLHYAETLREWLRRYEGHIDEVVALHGEHFSRAWRLYLAGSVAAFTTGTLQLFQVVFSRTGANDLPWTRAHLYHGNRSGAVV